MKFSMGTVELQNETGLCFDILYCASGKLCTDITITNSNVTAVAGHYGDVVTVACAPGFLHDGNSTFSIACAETGLWETGTCQSTAAYYHSQNSLHQ